MKFCFSPLLFIISNSLNLICPIPFRSILWEIVTLFEILFDFTKVAATASGFTDLNDAAINLAEKIVKLENDNLPDIFSKTVFITEDK